MAKKTRFCFIFLLTILSLFCDGNQSVPSSVQACPASVVQGTKQGASTGVYGTSCYELVPQLNRWFVAEGNCRKKGGHLVHIRDSTEEGHVMQFLRDTGFKRPVWLGLTDRALEHHFVWSSGDPVTFTKWMPGYYDYPESHFHEDCVVLIPHAHSLDPQRRAGLWNDIICTELHSWVCQYDAVPVPAHQGAYTLFQVSTKAPMFGPIGTIFDLIGRK